MSLELTLKETEALRLLTLGHTGAQAGLLLGVSRMTISSRVRWARIRNDCESTYELIYKLGLMVGRELGPALP